VCVRVCGGWERGGSDVAQAMSESMGCCLKNIERRCCKHCMARECLIRSLTSNHSFLVSELRKNLPVLVAQLACLCVSLNGMRWLMRVRVEGEHRMHESACTSIKAQKSLGLIEVEHVRTNKQTNKHAKTNEPTYTHEAVRSRLHFSLRRNVTSTHGQRGPEMDHTLSRFRRVNLLYEGCCKHCRTRKDRAQGMPTLAGTKVTTQ
jgi:hypothetical protein